MIISENESDNVEVESDFLISFLSFDDVLVMALLAFGAWGTETMVIQKLGYSEHSALNSFVFLIEAFLRSAFVIFNDYCVIQILINNIIQSNIE